MLMCPPPGNLTINIGSTIPGCSTVATWQLRTVSNSDRRAPRRLGRAKMWTLLPTATMFHLLQRLDECVSDQPIRSRLVERVFDVDLATSGRVALGGPRQKHLPLGSRKRERVCHSMRHAWNRTSGASDGRSYSSEWPTARSCPSSRCTS